MAEPDENTEVQGENADENTATAEATAAPPSEKKPDSIESRIQNQFNEEKWTRISSKDVGISRFKLLEDLLNEASQNNFLDELKQMSKDQIIEYETSVSASYFLGIIALKQDTPEEIVYLKQLLDQFEEAGKWAVVDFLSDKMLEVGENRAILRAKSNALEKLGKTKELIPILEKLAKIDRKNPDISLKYADAIIGEDPEKGILFYKLTAETYAKNLQFDKLKSVWNKLIDLIPDDFAFYRKIERVLSGHRQKDVLADLFVQLAYNYIKKEDVDNIIVLSKKILELNPNYTRFKNELVRSYRTKYAEHSLLEEFVKYSGLLDSRRNIANSIQNFETNIVFDKENYVFHRVWGVGKIVDLDTSQMIIDFKDKPAHKMEIQMALKSLKPLQRDHFWVHQYEDPDKLKEQFENDFVSFFKILVASFGNRISLADIKAELADVYVPLKSWSKWWTKSRALLLKDNNIRVSPQRKDILEHHETAVTFSELIIDKFQHTQGFDDRMAVALEALKETHDSIEGIEYMVPFFKETLKSLDLEDRLQSLWILDMFQDALGEDDNYYTHEQKKQMVEDLAKLDITTAAELATNLKSVDIKKPYVKWINDHHPEWQKIYVELLLQTPIKIHKNLMADLVSAEAWGAAQEFLGRLRKESKENAEIFLWSFKQLVTGAWTIPDVPMDEQVLGLFRLFRSIPKIETKGTKLKNAARDLVVGGTKEETMQVIEKEAKDSVRKISALLKDVSFFSDLEKQGMLSSLVEMAPQAFEEEEIEDIEKGQQTTQLVRKLAQTGDTVASLDAIDEMRKELDHLVKVEIPDNSKEIGLAQEKGDLRENAEYKAALERQSILQTQVTKLEEQVNKVTPLSVDLISTEAVSLGCKVRLRDLKTKDIFVYSILDQWDADVDKGIISYKSPLGKALLEAKVGDAPTFGEGSREQQLEVLSVDLAINREGRLV